MAGLVELYSVLGIVLCVLLLASGELRGDALARIVGLLLGAVSVAAGAIAALIARR